MVLMLFFRMVLYAPILGIGGVIHALETSRSMAWVILLAVVLVLGVVAVLFAITLPRFKKLQDLIDRLNLVTREILQGIPVIRAFSREKHEEQRFDKANKDFISTNLFVNRCMTFMMPIMMLVMNEITVLIVWTGCKGIDAGTMQVGDMMAYIQYTMMIIMSFLMITMMSIMLPPCLCFCWPNEMRRRWFFGIRKKKRRRSGEKKAWWSSIMYPLSIRERKIRCFMTLISRRVPARPQPSSGVRAAVNPLW